MKRIPGIRPRFTRCKIVRPDGSVLEAWEMFVGDRSYGRSNSRTALLKSWEARLEEAETGRPFAIRPMYRRAPHPDQRNAAKRPEDTGHRSKAPRKSA